MRFLTFLAFAFILLFTVGCHHNDAVGTWQEDVDGGGQLLITIRENKTFSALYSVTGQGAVLARVDGTYESLDDGGLQLHPTGANFVGGNPEAAAAEYRMLDDLHTFATNAVFRLMGRQRAQIPWGKETASMVRIQNNDLAPTLTQDEIEFSQKAFAGHQAILAEIERIGDQEKQRVSDQQGQQQPAYAQAPSSASQDQSQSPSDAQPADQSQPDPNSASSNTANTDRTTGTSPDSLPPGSATNGDSTPPSDNGNSSNSSTTGDDSTTGQQTSSASTTG